MAARAGELQRLDNPHIYAAQADLFSADLKQPVQRVVEPQAILKLPLNCKVAEYQYNPMREGYRVDGLISYRSGYTQVAAYPSTKHRGFKTLATSVIEDLNILEVLTADRVIGQISTTHPVYNPKKEERREDEGEVPSVTFLGTRFENLRINGRKVEVESNLDILGAKPPGDRSYFGHDGVLSRLAHHYFNINRVNDLPDWAREHYDWDKAEANCQKEMKCSLVSGVSGAPGTSFGHVIDLPDFGKIFLGELKVTRSPVEKSLQAVDSERPGQFRYRFHLDMIRLEFGCIADGSAKVVTLDTNGQGSGGDGGKH